MADAKHLHRALGIGHFTPKNAISTNDADMRMHAWLLMIDDGDLLLFTDDDRYFASPSRLRILRPYALGLVGARFVRDAVMPPSRLLPFLDARTVTRLIAGRGHFASTARHYHALHAAPHHHVIRYERKVTLGPLWRLLEQRRRSGDIRDE